MNTHIAHVVHGHEADLAGRPLLVQRDHVGGGLEFDRVERYRQPRVPQDIRDQRAQLCACVPQIHADFHGRDQAQADGLAMSPALVTPARLERMPDGVPQVQ